MSVGFLVKIKKSMFGKGKYLPNKMKLIIQMVWLGQYGMSIQNEGL